MGRSTKYLLVRTSKSENETDLEPKLQTPIRIPEKPEVEFCCGNSSMLRCGKLVAYVSASPIFIPDSYESLSKCSLC